MESTKAAQELESRRNQEPPKPIIELKPAPPDPINVLLNKVRRFVIDQDEYWEICQLPKPIRKKICNDLAKVMTRHPRFMK